MSLYAKPLIMNYFQNKFSLTLWLFLCCSSYFSTFIYCDSSEERGNHINPDEVTSNGAYGSISDSTNNTKDNDTSSKIDPYVATAYYNLYDFIWNTRESEFKFVVSSNGMQCFYQEYDNETSAHVSFEVIKGSEKTISLLVQYANKTDIYTESDKSEGTKEFFISKADTISFCFLNFGRLRSARMVHFYLMAMTRKKEVQKKTTNPGEEGSRSFRDSIASLATTSFKVMEAQALSRLRASKDLQIAKENQNFVQSWAVLHICLFLGAGVLQVAFVRYLFSNPFSYHKTKVRA